MLENTGCFEQQTLEESVFSKRTFDVQKDKGIAFYLRYMLTVEEAEDYFHIGAKKINKIIENHEGAKWYLYSVRRIIIKRERFVKWLDRQMVI